MDILYSVHRVYLYVPYSSQEKLNSINRFDLYVGDILVRLLEGYVA
jgi:hypothetical protein